MDLQEWTHIFIKQRDLVKRELSDIKPEGNGFLLVRKDGTTARAVVAEELNAEALQEKPVLITCLNTKKNVKVLALRWRDFSSSPELLVVFANSKTNEKWLLKPHLHARVADEKSLEAGLLSMHDAIAAAD
jgi:hypothetical protein